MYWFYAGCFLLTFNFCKSELTFRYLTLYNEEGELMNKNDIHKGSVNVSQPIIFVINGLDQSETVWVTSLIQEYLEKRIPNVFLLNLYNETDDQTKEIISSKIEDFINVIYNKTGEKYLHWRLIGIAATGYNIALDVGARISNNTTRKIDRITGLDPTYPSTETDNQIIFFDDFANMVDAVHSNIRKFEGPLGQYGHVDFYIDDLSCKNSEDPNCGFRNAVKMFKRSVNSEKLTAVKCPSLEDFELNRCASNNRVLFGENMPNNADGIYIMKFE
ncbi:hypothetical protein WA026_004142 [Henosepilachna vigintioctopunctata]|uniref:Lipase domain-containing protein n=1 Tax=Henosepilachna vigintioctopunctata TaxID=420089 RepID=A0AAW1UEU0_9CUCU